MHLKYTEHSCTNMQSTGNTSPLKKMKKYKSILIKVSRSQKFPHNGSNPAGPLGGPKGPNDKPSAGARKGPRTGLLF